MLIKFTYFLDACVHKKEAFMANQISESELVLMKIIWQNGGAALYSLIMDELEKDKNTWKNCISSSPVYVSPNISLIMGIISFRQSLSIVRNAPSYIFAMFCILSVCALIISFFYLKFKNFTVFHAELCGRKFVLV